MSSEGAYSKFDGLPALFANLQRVAVAERVLAFEAEPPEVFTADDVVHEFDEVVPAASVANALRHMQDLGMVALQPSPSYDRRKHLVRVGRHPFWSVISAAVDAANARR